MAVYTYNGQGGIERITLQTPGSSAQVIASNIDYGHAGQITQIAYGNGVATTYNYDADTLRLRQLQTIGPTGLQLQNFTYTFDALGNIAGIQDTVHTGTQQFSYDALNRLVFADGASYGPRTYAYDPIGNMVQKEGVAMAYGESAGPHAVTSTSAGWSMRYDANGNMVEKTTSDQPGLQEITTQQLTFDAENRLVEVRTAQEETVPVTFKPEWNFFALPVILDDASLAAILPNFGASFEQLARYVPATNRFEHYVGTAKFDDFEKLEYGVGHQVYYKGTSDLTIPIQGRLPSQQLAKSLSAGWHLLPSTSLQTGPVSTVFAGLDADHILTWDRATKTLKPATEVVAGLAYWVHLRTAGTFRPSLPRDPTTRFVYDGDGGRVKKTTAAGTTVFLGQSYEIAPGNVATKYVFAGSQRIAAKDSTGLKFYHGDHLGSSNVITDQTGTKIELAEYAPYGTLARREGTGNVGHKFTGQRLDADTGLYFYNARYYDPTLGRFISADSIVQAPASPQTLNRYTYAGNNPARFIDPSGNIFFVAALLALAKIAVVGAAIGAVTGAFVGAVSAAVTGQSIAGGLAAGFVSGAAFGATAFTGGALMGVLAPAFGASLLGQASLVAVAGAVSGGVGSSYSGGSFASGLLPGAIGGVVSFGVVKGIGASSLGQAVARSPFGQAVGRVATTATAPIRQAYGTLATQLNTAIRGELVRPRIIVGEVRAMNAPLDHTQSGETFIRAASSAEKLRFSFKSPGGTLGQTHAFPKNQFLKFNNDPQIMRNLGDLPGAPTVYREISPPPGTPIQRGIVPGGEYGGDGGAQEVYFPEDF